MPPKAHLAGQVFGRLTVIRECAERAQHGKNVWECLCECGNTVYSIVRLLNNGQNDRCAECKKKSRGSKPAHNKRDLTGQRFAHVTVLKEVEQRIFPSGHKKTQYACKCDCGAEFIALGSSLTTGNTKSCGCWAREVAGNRVRTHGLTHTKVHRIWQAMLNRCRNPNSTGYENYGGRGITVCERWYSFENFLSDMGHPPNNHSIDRINNEGNYEPGNCRWASGTEQCRNKRDNRIITFRGESLPLIVWSERIGIDQAAMRERLEKWPIELALTKPKHGRISEC